MIEIFQLVKERCMFVHLNVRTELHGDERETAIDLQFEFSGANNLLLKLHPDLRSSFYRPDDTKDLATPDHMPHLRYPLMGDVAWDLEIPRTRLRIHDVDSPENDVVLGGGKTNKFKLTMLDGGTVKWKFRCQFSKPDEEIVAKLMRVLNQAVPISLECAAEEEKKADNFEQADMLGKGTMSPERQEAENLFAKPTTDMSLAPDAGASSEGAKPEAAATNVEPITRAKRGGRKVAGGAAIE